MPQIQPLHTAVGSFLFAFPALFSIVNPIGSSLMFFNITAAGSHTERAALARQIAIYALSLLLGSVWLGSYALNFFGVSLGALRVAGGLVVAVTAWRLLNADDTKRSAGETDSTANRRLSSMAFFPLTMPLTTGPGSISVAIALASERPASGEDALAFFGGVSVAAFAIALMVFASYIWADRVVRIVGPSGAEVVGRLVAFLLLCIGVQILCTGAEALLNPWLVNAARAIR